MTGTDAQAFALRSLEHARAHRAQVVRAVRLTHASQPVCVCESMCVRDRYASGSPFETYIYYVEERRSAGACGVMF